METDTSTYAIPELPSELAGPVPRKVMMNLTDGDGRAFLAAFFCFFIPGLICLAWQAHDDVKQFQQRAILRRNAREVVGKVTGFAHHRYSPISDDYRFTVDGVTYSGEAMEPGFFEPRISYRKGDGILVRFLPSNPEINHPDAWEWSPFIDWFIVLFEIFLISISGLAFASLFPARRLARIGKPAAAVVTSCIPKDRLFRIEYEFHTETGETVSGNDTGTDEYEIGARIWILYLPQKPRRNAIYPLPLCFVLG